MQTATMQKELKNVPKKSFWSGQVGTIKSKGDSVKEIRKIRWILSKKIKSFEDIKNL